jgi:hypothetical protein
VAIQVDMQDVFKAGDEEKLLRNLGGNVTDEEISARRDELSKKKGGKHIAKEEARLRVVRQKLEPHMQKMAKAAFAEYAEMLLGMQIASRADEIRERRVYYLIKHYYEDRIPLESELVSLFQLPESTCRRILRNIRAKFRNELEQEITNSVVNVLSKPEKNGDDFRFIIRSDNVLEEIKQVVSTVAAGLDQVHKLKNSANVYVIPVDTYKALCTQYSLDFGDLTEDL